MGPLDTSPGYGTCYEWLTRLQQHCIQGKHSTNHKSLSPMVPAEYHRECISCWIEHEYWTEYCMHTQPTDVFVSPSQPWILKCLIPLGWCCYKDTHYVHHMWSKYPDHPPPKTNQPKQEGRINVLCFLPCFFRCCFLVLFGIFLVCVFVFLGLTTPAIFGL